MSFDLEKELTSLNDEQREAVLHEKGPCVVIAPAGSGKTGMLTLRYARLSKLVGKERLLCMTFTKKAAEEMRVRIGAMLDIPEASLKSTIGTFHALFFPALKLAQQQGLIKHGTELIEPHKQTILVRNTAAKHRLSYAEFNEFLEMAKRQGFTPDAMPETGAMRDAFIEYVKTLRDKGMIDFADMLIIPSQIMSTNEAFRQKWASRFSHILVDEGQDMDPIQHKLLMQTGRDAYNIFTTGDPRQAIFSWRAGNHELFQTFDPEAGDPVVINLKRNYRSRPKIVACANTLIRKNMFAHVVDQEAEANEKPGVVVLKRLGTEAKADDEAMWLFEQINRLHDAGMSYHDIAVLCRCNSQFRLLQDTLYTMNVPYTIIAGGGFYGSQEVVNLMAFFRLAVSDGKDEAALYHLLRSRLPFTKYIGKAFWDDVCCQFKEGARYAGLKHFESDKKWLVDRAAFIHNFLGAMMLHIRNESPAVALKVLLDKSEYMRWLREEYRDEIGFSREDKIDELVSLAKDFETPEELLAHIEKMKSSEVPPDSLENRVHLSTLHQAKGKEWKTVFICGVRSGVLPHAKAMEVKGGLKEERNIMYVGITRGKDKVCVITYGEPSMFIEEMQNGSNTFDEDILPEDEQGTVVEEPTATGFVVRHTGRSLPTKEDRILATTQFGAALVCQAIFSTDGEPDKAFLRELVENTGLSWVGYDSEKGIISTFDFDASRAGIIIKRMTEHGFIHLTDQETPK